MKTVSVQLPQRSYDILIKTGLLQDAAQHFAPYAGRRAVIISDNTVYALYGGVLEQSFGNVFTQVLHFAFPAGEQSKNIHTLGAIYAFLADNLITRGDLIIALGGGVVGDVAGFAAASFLRGVSFVQVPTTLLAQIDSSVGGKTAIDLPQGKNLIGAFYQPKAVLIDPNCLETLSPHFYADGLGEAIKYGCICNPDLFGMIGGSFDMETVIEQCVISKRDIVQKDEFDTGLRMLLNFGHTIGHAIEKAENFAGLSHGMAVGVGMVMITRQSEKAGWTKPGTADKIAQKLAQCGLPAETDVLPGDIISGAAGDKKKIGAVMNIVILEEIGRSKIMQIDDFDKFMRQ